MKDLQHTWKFHVYEEGIMHTPKTNDSHKSFGIGEKGVDQAVEVSEETICIIS